MDMPVPATIGDMIGLSALGDVSKYIPIPGKLAYEKIVHQVAEFEERLNKDEEIGLRLVAAPDKSTMRITDLGYWGDVLIFHGVNEHNKPVQLLQHYTQMSILLTAVPAGDDEPRRIGFHLVSQIGEASDDADD